MTDPAIRANIGEPRESRRADARHLLVCASVLLYYTSSVGLAFDTAVAYICNAIAQQNVLDGPNQRLRPPPAGLQGRHLQAQLHRATI
jgi:hypothetical protein